MKRLILAAAALALAIPLAACGDASLASAGTDAPPAPIGAKLAELERSYADAKAFVGLFLPFTSLERAAQIHAIERRIDRYLAAARAAVTLGEHLAALARAEAAIAELER